MRKVILFIPSIILILFVSCGNESKNENSIDVVEQTISKEELIDDFFSQLEKWTPENIDILDSLGMKISQLDSNLNFLPYENDYEHNSFIFSSTSIEGLNIFENNNFLMENSYVQQSSYKVWRRKLNNLNVLDLSIEPHPSLGWLFVMRKRGQE